MRRRRLVSRTYVKQNQLKVLDQEISRQRANTTNHNTSIHEDNGKASISRQSVQTVRSALSGYQSIPDVQLIALDDEWEEVNGGEEMWEELDDSDMMEDDGYVLA